MREQVYTDPRPKEYFDRFHARARTREPDFVYEMVRVVTSLYAYTFLRARAIAVENVPGSGAVILAPNHFSFMDHFLMGCYIRRKVRFMAKSQLFNAPMEFIYTHGGVFPVRRGARDEEVFITARAIMERGGAITMYCEGGRSRTGKMSEKAKPGIGRLALETGTPVVPIAIYGSSKVRNWKRLQFPKVTIQYGEAMRWEQIDNPTREQQQAVADQVLRRSGGSTRAWRSTAGGASCAACASSAALAAARRKAPRSPDARTLDVGGVIRKVWEIYVDQASVLMPAAAVVFVFTGIISAVLIKAGSGLAILARAHRAGGHLGCSRAWSWSSSPMCRTVGAMPPRGSCCEPSCRCSAR